MDYILILGVFSHFYGLISVLPNRILFIVALARYAHHNST